MDQDFEAIRYDSYSNGPIKFMANYEYRDDPKDYSGKKDVP